MCRAGASPTEDPYIVLNVGTTHDCAWFPHQHLHSSAERREEQIRSAAQTGLGPDRLTRGPFTGSELIVHPGDLGVRSDMP